jgi:hypothetical protein
MEAGTLKSVVEKELLSTLTSNKQQLIMVEESVKDKVPSFSSMVLMDVSNPVTVMGMTRIRPKVKVIIWYL